MAHFRENGKLSQGYYCCKCGQPCNMYATGHENCTPNPRLVRDLDLANKQPKPRLKWANVFSNQIKMR